MNAKIVGRTRHLPTLWVVVLAAGVLRLVLSLFSYEYFIDDAYIYMRIVDNFVDGNGLFYNPNEAVLGFTLLTYVPLLALFRLLFPSAPSPLIVSFVNLGLFCVLCYALCLLLGSLKKWFWPALVAVLFYFPLVDANLNGMETTLFLCVLGGSLVFVKTKQWSAAMVTAALAVLTRPEGLFLLIPVSWLAFRESRWKDFLRASMLAGAMLAAFWIPAILIYGTFIPHSMLAKSSHLANEGVWIETGPLVKAVLLAFGLSDLSFLALPDLVRTAVLAAFIGALALFFLGLKRDSQIGTQVQVAGAFYLLVVCFYILGEPVRVFIWYTIPTCMAFLYVVFHGVERLDKHLGSTRMTAALSAGVVVMTLLTIPAVLPVRLQSISADAGALE